MNFSVDNIKKNIKWLSYLLLCVLMFVFFAFPALKSGYSLFGYTVGGSFSTYSLLGFDFAQQGIFALLLLLTTVVMLLLIGYKLTVEFFGEAIGASSGKPLTMQLGSLDLDFVTKIAGITYISLVGTYFFSLLNATTLSSVSLGYGAWLILIFNALTVAAFEIVLKKLVPGFADETPKAPKAPAVKFKCSQCGSPAPRGAAFCQKCGGKVIEYTPEPAPVIVYMCEKCGNRSRKGIAFCSICGGKIIERAYRPQPKPQAPAPAPAPAAPQATAAPAPQPQYQAAPQAPAAPAAPQPQAQPQAVCANCGAPAIPGARFCNLCGGQIVMR